jgi:hypothetical protein
MCNDSHICVAWFGSFALEKKSWHDSPMLILVWLTCVIIGLKNHSIPTDRNLGTFSCILIYKDDTNFLMSIERCTCDLNIMNISKINSNI